MNLNTNIGTAGAVGLATAVILVWLIGLAPLGIIVPEEVAAAIGTICVFVWGLVIKPSATP